MPILGNILRVIAIANSVELSKVFAELVKWDEFPFQLIESHTLQIHTKYSDRSHNYSLSIVCSESLECRRCWTICEVLAYHLGTRTWA